MKHFQYVATSEQGFVQQVVSGWVRNGYYFYVTGEIPEGKDPLRVDEKFFHQYPIRMSAGRRFSRKQRGLYNVAYVRYQRTWIMLATGGEFEDGKGYVDWFQQEARNIGNCRRGKPIQLFGYSIYYVPGGFVANWEKANPDGPPERDKKYRVRVQMSQHVYRDLLARLVAHARSRRPEWFAEQFWKLPFEPYAPVRQQQLEILRQVNAKRKAAGLEKLPPTLIRYRKEPVKVFED